MPDFSSSPSDATSPDAAPRPSWYRRLYLRVEAMSASPHALLAMAAVSVVDGSVFPIPPFALLVPMVLARPNRWVRYSLVGIAASIVGGLIGYWLGTLLHGGAINFLHFDPNFRVDRFGIHATVAELLGRNIWMLAALCSVLPTPLKIVAIGSGAVGVPLPQFFLALVIGRTVRFFVVAGFMRFVGPSARRWLRV
ncbi:DedA family protein [Aggregicoccus sp. 17bor-14]|uniref:YqaA family protein n=1 Tax=Myxococcaceae TaxID=31 RepID=UPI00129C889B|nr:MULTISPECIES: VTT domain-containing protein [Myxococcaceae]MBF5046110.1 DedA family protein [Simulacricoccus sp. 17bor-14]MRI91837.1 DedA family protein [Aggregicoccus sp. 17bor-14]